MNLDDLNSIIRLAGIKKNIAEVEGMSPPPLDNPGVLRSSDGKPVGSSDPNLKWNTGTASTTATTDIKRALGPVEPQPSQGKTDTAQTNTKADPAVVGPISTPSITSSAVNLSQQSDINVNTPLEQPPGEEPPGEEPTGSSVLDPTQNSDTSTNVPGGTSAGGAGTVPKKPTKTLLPVDEKIKAIQEKLKALGYNLGPYGADGRLGKFTRQAIDDFKAGTPPSGSGTATKTSARPGTPSPASTAATNNAQLQALKQQAERQRKSGDEAGARATERAMAMISTPPSQTPAATSTGRGAGFTDPRTVKPGEPLPKNGTVPSAPVITPEQAREREAVLRRLERRFGLSENFNNLSPVQQIQKIRHMVDLTEQRDALGWSTEPKPIINPDVRAPGPAAADAVSTAGKASKAAVAKAALGSAWKKVAPGAGAAFGAYDAYHRGKEGDWLGAGLAGASAIASFLPGPGTAVALGLDAINIGRDVAAGKFDNPAPEISPQERAQIEQDWETLEPYYTNPALFNSLSAKDQARLTALKQKAKAAAAAAK